MKKPYFYNTLLLLISFLLILGCSNKNEKDNKIIKFPYYKTDLEEMKLRGKIKSFKEYSYKAIDSFGVISKGKKQHIDGFEAYPEGVFLTFNTEGFFKESTEYTVYEKINEKIIYSYNQKGQKIEQNVYDSINKFDYKVVFKYNEKGYLFDRSLYDEKGKLNKKFVFENNENDNEIKESLYSSKGNLDSYYKYKYDNKGNLIETSFIDYGRLVISENTIYIYDVKGNLILKNSSITIKEGTVDIETNYTYNTLGDIESIDSTTYEYIYDSNNNWIKRIEYNSGFPKFVLERKIEYY